MQREFLILMREDKGCGAVKIERREQMLVAEIEVEQNVVLEREQVFKAYISMPEKSEVRYLGVLDDHKGSFTLGEVQTPFGIAVTVKNTGNGEEKLYCVCAEEGRIEEVKSCFEGGGNRKTPQKQNTELKFEREYVKTSEAKLFELFPEFEFEKVKGYFLRKNSRIAEYIMAGKEVYRRINENGYYYFALNRNGEFVVAVPSKTGEETPFEGCKEYSFSVGADMPGGTVYFCIVAGADENGEYFCRKK